MSSWGFRPYVPVAARRAQAAKEIEKLGKKGRAVSPVVVEGRKIARSFWGKAWCDNLERYSDFANRLPRGRTYVNNGSVIDLQIERGKVAALVSGTKIYKVSIDVTVASSARWTAICADCAGSVGSLVELLQGKLSKNVMERVCREADGLFPAPREIKMSCSCPDWAGMCKHVAATLYGVGARLDSQPDFLFKLRGVNREDMVSTVGANLPLTATPAASDRVLAADDVAALFGLDMADPAGPSCGLDTAVGAFAVAGQAMPCAEATQAITPAQAKTKTKEQTAVATREPQADRKSRRVTQPAATSAARSTKAKSPSDKPPVDRMSAAGPQPETVVEGDVQPQRKRLGAPSAQPGRTRAAKWIGGRARGTRA
jgi:uncharacterized Zn finger protein